MRKIMLLVVLSFFIAGCTTTGKETLKKANEVSDKAHQAVFDAI